VDTCSSNAHKGGLIERNGVHGGLGACSRATLQAWDCPPLDLVLVPVLVVLVPVLVVSGAGAGGSGVAGAGRLEARTSELLAGAAGAGVKTGRQQEG
jgi:hypothetical protein